MLSQHIEDNHPEEWANANRVCVHEKETLTGWSNWDWGVVCHLSTAYPKLTFHLLFWNLYNTYRCLAQSKCSSNGNSDHGSSQTLSFSFLPLTCFIPKTPTHLLLHISASSDIVLTLHALFPMILLSRWNVFYPQELTEVCPCIPASTHTLDLVTWDSFYGHVYKGPVLSTFTLDCSHLIMSVCPAGFGVPERRMPPCSFL